MARQIGDISSPSFDGYAFTKIASRVNVFRFAALLNFLAIAAFHFGRKPSRRRQEIDWVHDCHGLHAILRTEIDGLNPAHHLSGEIRRIHVSRLQLAH
jgi:hypothetical protein